VLDAVSLPGELARGWTRIFFILPAKKGTPMSTHPDAAAATTTPLAQMTQEELEDAIGAVMTKAHLNCQPYYLQLALLHFPGVPMLRSESYVSSVPVGPNAVVDTVSTVLMEPGHPATELPGPPAAA
jgi:hypothetical protein